MLVGDKHLAIREAQSLLGIFTKLNIIKLNSKNTNSGQENPKHTISNVLKTNYREIEHIIFQEVKTVR